MKSHQSLFVGITADEDPSSPYLKSSISLSEIVKKLGGIPLLISSWTSKDHIKKLVKHLSAFIVTGGAFDIPPSYYREKQKHRVDPPQLKRTNFELQLIKEAMTQKKPILGICGGMQAINVALGGTLFQDIRAEIPCAKEHEQKVEKSKPTHFVNVVKNSKLCKILEAKRVQVNSTHHQAVKELGKNLTVSGFSDDGVVEAIESANGSFVLGVQWHPEVLKDKSSDKIFESFIRRRSKNN